jgi:hypothetical protein
MLYKVESMSSMNAAKAKFSQLSASLAPYKSTIQLVLYIIVAVIVFYTIYVVLFPPPDIHQQVIIDQTQSAAGSLELRQKLNKNVAIETGGEYTFQTWIYISNWDYKAGQIKHVFTLSSDGTPGGGRPDHHTMIGALYPNENKMMIRIFQDTSTSAGAPASQGPDFTVKTNTQALFSGSVGVGMFDNSVGFPICDIQDIDLQKWICLAVVVNGRVIDVYVDGKLARSCVTAGIPTVEKGNHFVSMGKFTGWGGNVSTTRVFGYALTPGKIYELYQTGPANTTGLDAKFGFAGWLAERMGIRMNTTEKASRSKDNK